MIESKLTQDELDAIAKALRIVGAEDCSSDGIDGAIVVEGRFANAILEAQLPDLRARESFGVTDKPVRISRSDHLETWCNGFYVEGSSVRGSVHQAARAVGFYG